MCNHVPQGDSERRDLSQVYSGRCGRANIMSSLQRGATGCQRAGRCKTWVIQIEPPETYSTNFRLKCWSLMKERSTREGATGIGRGGSKHAKPLRYRTTSLWWRQPKNSCSRKAYSRKDGGGGLSAGATNPTSGSYGTMNMEARCDRTGVFLRYGGMIQKWRHFRTRK